MNEVQNIIEASNKLGEAVAQFIRDMDSAYNQGIVANDRDLRQIAYQRGTKIAELRNKLQGALVMWTIDTESFRRAEGVRESVEEYNKKHPDAPISFWGLV